LISNGKSVNDELLKEGWARVDTSKLMGTDDQFKNTLLKTEGVSREKRKGMWRFGDLDSDDEDEEKDNKRRR